MPGRVGLGALSKKTGNFPRVRLSGHLTEVVEPIEDGTLANSVSEFGDRKLS
jgi:hypothetical protein